MLVPKLDYLQYMLAKQVITFGGSKAIALWHPRARPQP